MLRILKARSHDKLIKLAIKVKDPLIPLQEYSSDEIKPQQRCYAVHSSPIALECSIAHPQDKCWLVWSWSIDSYQEP